MDQPSVEQAFSTIRVYDVESGHSQSNAPQALQVLAEASRSASSVRSQLADNTIFSKLIDVVRRYPREIVDHTTKKAALRCIGNACNDNGSNDNSTANTARHEISTRLGFSSWITPCFTAPSDDETKWLAVKVLYNICSTSSDDSNSASQRCYTDKIYEVLVGFCAEREAQTDDLTLLIDVIFWITNCRPPPGEAEAVPEDCLSILLTLPSLHCQSQPSRTDADDLDIADLATLVEINLTFLRDPLVQAQIVASRHVRLVWDMLLLMESRIDVESGMNETNEIIKPLASSLLWCLSDLAAQKDFHKLYHLHDDFIVSLMRRIRADPTTDIGSNDRGAIVGNGTGKNVHAGNESTKSLISTTAAYQMLGNLLWALAPDASTSLVSTEHIHVAIWNTIVGCSSSSSNAGDRDGLLHSAAGFLMQLSRPSSAVREVIGDDGNAAAGLAVLCESKTPQVKEAGMKLLQALGRGCPVNQARFAELARAVLAVSVDGNGDDHVPSVVLPDTLS